MYCTMLMFLAITNPVNLWECHWRILTDDLLYQLREQVKDNTLLLEDNELQNMGLIKIECILNRNGRSLIQFPPMPLPSIQPVNMVANQLIREELAYDYESKSELFNRLYSELNQDQL
ncbi:hypothetical protein ACH5RR_021048 [Cinchona calisaya]|uniref:Uncharacterized protein n=1 Tax=Cinchona calisaya TaxID=153742 RepID=A0ABD2ZG77_9GENT